MPGDVFSFWCKVQCLDTESGTHEIPDVFLFKFMFLSVYYCKVLSSMNEQQQNSNASCKEEYILHIMTIFLVSDSIYI